MILITVKIECLHGDKINNSFVFLFQSYGHLHHHRVQSEFFLELIPNLVRVGTGTVGLVDEGHPGNAVTLELTIDGDGLTLYTAHRTEDKNCSVQDP